MKIHKDIFRTLAKRVWRGEHTLDDHEPMHPARDWLMGLFIALCGFVIVIVFGVQQYLFYRTVDVGETTVGDEELLMYRASAVADALAVIDARAKTLRTNKTGTETETELPDGNVPPVPETDSADATTTESISPEVAATSSILETPENVSPTIPLEDMPPEPSPDDAPSVPQF
jgi:hypothetical protein